MRSLLPGDSLFVGIMSGTSLDGADAVLADFSGGNPRVLGFASIPFPARLRDQLLQLSRPGGDSLDLAGEASRELAGIYAIATQAALSQGGIAPLGVRAIGCHGQTVRHRPEIGFTMQLNDAARLAELAGIEVVADFRRRDMAAGGQGAPLVPAFHDAVFRSASQHRAVVNIGGIANVTALAPEAPTRGFDCGPGNVLMDLWIARHRRLAFDEGGRWAASGHRDRDLLARFMDEAYLQIPPPKSTGRELFDTAWLDTRVPKDLAPQDVQATLAEFTARTILEAIDRFCPGTQEIFVAGGGGRNTYLMTRLSQLAAPRRVDVTDALGVPTGLVEPLAFAWLAMKCVRREPVDLSAATGASGPRILGAIYPA